jgi:hypothetical protein
MIFFFPQKKKKSKMSEECFLGSGRIVLSPQAPLLVTGITILTATPNNVKTNGKVSKFPPCNSDIVTGFESNTFGKIKLGATVNITSVQTTATVSLQIITGGGAVLTTETVNTGTTGTEDYTLRAKTYTQPGTQYFLELVILNSDPATSVTVNGGSFVTKIKAN